MSLSVFTLLIAAPFIAGIIYAVLYSFGLTGYSGNGFTLLHWKNVFMNSEIVYSFLFTFYVGATSIIVSVTIAFSFMMAGKQKENNWLTYFLYLPLAIPATVAAFFSFQFLAKAGFLSRVFYALGLTKSIESFADLINDSFGIGIIITHIFLSVPFFIVLFQNYYHSEKLETLKELSFTLGATQTQFNFKILIPLLLRKTFTPIVLYFIFMLGSYEIPLLLGTSSPQMVSVLITRMLKQYNLADIPQGYIIAILYTSMILLLLMMAIKTKNKSNAQYV